MKPPSRFFSFLVSPKILASLLVIGSVDVATAASNTWTGSVDGNWDTTTANWTSPTTWANGDIAIFTNTGANQSITLASGISLQSFGTVATNQVITVTGGAYTFGGSTLTVSNFNGDSIFTTTGTGIATFNTGIDISAATQGSIRFTAAGGDITLNNGVAAGSRQLQLGFFSSGGNLNLAGGTFSTTNQIVATHSSMNLTGSATLSTTNAYSQANGTMNVNGAGATFSAGSDANSDFFGRTRNTAAFNVQQGSATFSGGLSLMNVENSAAIGNTATLAVSGGRLTVGGAGASGGINLIRNAGSTSDQDGTAVFNQSGGVTTTTRINFGLGGVVDTGTSATVNVSGGELYIGAGGITKNATYATLTTAINLSGGTVGADATWSSSHNMTLTNTNGGVTFKAANEGGTSADITLSGVLSGGGGFTKSGGGTLTLSNASNQFGSINITAGIVSISNDDTILDTSNVSVFGTGVFDLNFSGTDTVNMLSFNGSALAVGTWGSSTSGAANTAPWLTGSGVLNVTAVPEPSTIALCGIGVAMSLFAFRRRRHEI